ncbi:succinate dehydrogenase, cytochrome b556 subunit [Parasphingorhabdus sp.]|uniref:succinate dehydrogenase, cytochrome b556 subunit n=1 Tax=Parasphingorhabdus sp. TaxID=2709688 RepID=UPI003297F759
MVEPSNRPLSPHLGIYKWGPAMLVSILHRATGDALALLGAPILVWWLYSISAGPESYEFFVGIMTTIPGFIVMIGMTFALFEHTYSGLRHFVLDAGAGYELQTNKLWSAAVPVLALLSTAALWFFISSKLIG